MLPTKLLVSLLASASLTAAHFLLNTPTTIGFDDDNEGISPCGGFNVSFDKVSDFHVDGDAVSVRSTHPQANWLFRATLDKTAAGNWTDLGPVINEGELGAFCEESVKVPAEWAGSQGVLQIVQNAVDGLLYQVSLFGIAVHFYSICLLFPKMQRFVLLHACENLGQTEHMLQTLFFPISAKGKTMSHKVRQVALILTLLLLSPSPLVNDNQDFRNAYFSLVYRFVYHSLIKSPCSFSAQL